MRLTPVVASPASSACWMGAAPRHRGSSDACTFTQPSRGHASTPGGSKRPYATTSRSGAGPRRSRISAVRNVGGCKTSTPSSRAATFTGEGVRRRPRPAGRSGCVSTSGTRAPLAATARSVGTANSGVPANAMRAGALNAARESNDGYGLRLPGVDVAPAPLRLLGGLLLQALALELGQVVDEELAVQVIHLVLDADGQQTFRLELERLAGPVERAHLDLGGAVDVVVELRHRQAPFLGVGRALGAHDFGVDQAKRLLVLGPEVADKDSLVNIDLRRGKADAGCGIHRLEHVRDQPLDLGIDFCDGVGADSEARVRILQYWETCHCGSASISCITPRSLLNPLTLQGY